MDSIHATETLPKCAYYCFICNANMDKCVFMLIGWIIGISKNWIIVKWYTNIALSCMTNIYSLTDLDLNMKLSLINNIDTILYI